MLRRLTLGAGCLLTVVTAGAVAAAAASDSAPPGGLTWGACEEGIEEPFECATLTVPLDYSQPAGATIDLALIRYPAEPAVREGAILLNPGGPGGSGYEFAASAAGRSTSRWASAAASTSSASIHAVSTAPAASTASTTLRPTRSLYSDDTPDDDAEYAATIAREVAFGQACRQVYGDTLRQYSTENTARDMDMIRAALGDEQLSYLGVSYGTYLGGVYATLFPERVRAMVLDSAFEPSGDSEYDQWVTQLVGFEQAFEQLGGVVRGIDRVRLPRGRCRGAVGRPDRRPRSEPGEVGQRPARQPGGDGDGDGVGDVQRDRLASARQRSCRGGGGRRDRPAADGRRLQRSVRRRHLRQPPPVRPRHTLR